MELQGKAGPGAFQWNRGGWFGSQVGATLWIVLLGASLLPSSPGLGGLVVTLGLIPNALGGLLWRRRQTLSPYPALQALLATCGLAALLALVCLRAAGVAGADTLHAWGSIALYPGLMLVFHLRERSARRHIAAGR